MPEIEVTIVLPNGGARKAELPDDVTVGDLLGGAGLPLGPAHGRARRASHGLPPGQQSPGARAPGG